MIYTDFLIIINNNITENLSPHWNILVKGGYVLDFCKKLRDFSETQNRSKWYIYSSNIEHATMKWMKLSFRETGYKSNVFFYWAYAKKCVFEQKLNNEILYCDSYWPLDLIFNKWRKNNLPKYLLKFSQKINFCLFFLSGI